MIIIQMVYYSSVADVSYDHHSDGLLFVLSRVADVCYDHHSDGLLFVKCGDDFWALHGKTKQETKTSEIRQSYKEWTLSSKSED